MKYRLSKCYTKRIAKNFAEKMKNNSHFMEELEQYIDQNLIAEIKNYGK